MPEKKHPQNLQTNTSIIRIASAIGMLVSGYLAYVKLFHIAIYCTPGLGDCETVNSSTYSILFGVPLGVWGLIGYTALFLLITFGKKIYFFSEYLDLTIFAISLGGFLFSIYLTSLELFVIKATCQWCILSAVMMTLIFIASVFRLVVKSAKLSQSGGKSYAKN